MTMRSSDIKKYVGIVLVVFALVTFAGVWWGYAHLTALIQARLKIVVSADLSVEKVTARWNRIELDQVRIARRGNGPFPNRFSCDRVVITPSLFSLFSGRLDISEILLENPFLLLEINPNGSIAKILPPRPAATAPGPASAVLPVRISSMRITKGIIDLLDWQVARKGGVGMSNPRERYHQTRLQAVTFSAGELTIPFSERPMPVRLELSSKGGGHLLIAGDLEVSAGTLSATSTLVINKRNLNAPGSLYLKGLSFDHSRPKGALLGVPAWALISFLSDNKDELSVPFTVNGSLDNPRFSAHQSLTDQIATALSSKIGVPTVSGVGKRIIDIGEKSIKGIFGITGTKK